jgi:restriction endonuclease Mrr
MPIPRFDAVMLSFLRYASDEKEHAIGEAREALAQEFKLTDEDRRMVFQSGKACSSIAVSAGLGHSSKRPALLNTPGGDTSRSPSEGLIC